MIEYKNIDIKVHDGVMQIGINRTDKKNALTGDMYDAMRRTLSGADKNPDVKVVLLHGTSDIFCAGNDLQGFDRRDPNKPSPGLKFLYAIQAFNKPIVAAVAGIAIGIGATLLLHCDLVYANENTRFRLAFVNLGVCPEAGTTLLLPANAGIKKASEVLMLGDFFNTKKAVELGMVNESIANQNILDYAAEKAEQLAQKPHQALLLIKQLLKQNKQKAVVDCMTLESKFFGELLLTEESIDARTKLKNRIQKSKNS